MPILHTNDGAQLSYEVVGEAGDPLLMIPGTALDRHAWDSVIPYFSRAHQVILFDSRGTGKSTAEVPKGWSTREFAEDAAAVILAAGFERAHVYGHSMGGRVAQWLAADYPSHVGALVLGGVSVGEKHGIPRPAEATLALTENDPSALKRMFYPDRWIEENPDAAEAVFPNALSETALAAHLHAAMFHDGWDALPRIKSPTLVVHGADDRLTVAGNATIVAEGIPDATLLVVDDARHAYWVGRPEVNSQILAFLRQHAFYKSR